MEGLQVADWTCMHLEKGTCMSSLHRNGLSSSSSNPATCQCPASMPGGADLQNALGCYHGQNDLELWQSVSEDDYNALTRMQPVATLSSNFGGKGEGGGRIPDSGSCNRHSGEYHDRWFGFAQFGHHACTSTSNDCLRYDPLEQNCGQLQR